MSAEITVKMGLAVRKGGTVTGIDLGSFSVTMTGTNVLRHRQSVGTAVEAITLGDVVAGGWILAINRDATNFVQIRAASVANPLIRLKAGEAALFRLDATYAAAPHIQADTAACEVEFLILED